MNNFRKFLLLLPCVLVLFSCERRFYSTNTIVVPVFQEKNEVYLNGGVAATGSGGDVTGGYLHAGYSFSDHVAAAVAYQHFQGPTETTATSGYGDYFEGMAGYYHAVPVPLGAFVFEGYGGFGHGSQTQLAAGRQDPTEALKFNRVFVQPQVGYNSGRSSIISLAAGLKPSYLSFTKITQSGPISREPNYQYLLVDQNAFLAEPHFTVRVGYKFVKLQVQQVLTFTDSRHAKCFFEGNTSIGLAVDLAPRYRN